MLYIYTVFCEIDGVKILKEVILHESSAKASSMNCASNKEFSTSYLFKEQGTSEGSEWFQIDLKCDRGALSDSYIPYFLK